jgi:hypothetical protein
MIHAYHDVNIVDAKICGGTGSTNSGACVIWNSIIEEALQNGASLTSSVILRIQIMGNRDGILFVGSSTENMWLSTTSKKTWATDSVVDPMIVREGWVMFTCSLYVPGNMKTVAGAVLLSDAIAAPTVLKRGKIEGGFV